MRETIEKTKLRLAEFEERQRQWREEQQRKENEVSTIQQLSIHIGVSTSLR